MGASESKLAFKQSVFLLAGDEDISPFDPLWAQFYTLPESAEDVFALWSPNDLRALTRNTVDLRPPLHTQIAPRKNLETLIYTTIARLQAFQRPQDSDNAQLTPVAEILNCMRILTRLLPYLYEADHLKDWQQDFFWKPRRPTRVLGGTDGRTPIYFDGLDPRKKFQRDEIEQAIGTPIGETLLELIIDYLFFPGFAIPRRVREDGTLDTEIVVKVWQSGIGSNKSLNCTKEHEKHQMETLRLLIALSSKPMYTQTSAVATCDVEPLTWMTTRLESRVTNGIVCSLLNTVLKYNPNAWNIPIDLTTKISDPKKLLVMYALQLLLLLVTYQAPLNDKRNQFRHALSMLHRADDFQFIQQGLSQVLAHPIRSTSANLSYFQNKDKALPWAPEMLSLLWELMQCNRRFRRYLNDTGGALDYVILLLFYALDAKDHSTRHGTLRLSIFALQTLSVEAPFATKLNTPFAHSETLPAVMRIPNFHGSYGDFLICSIHTIFTTPKGRLEAVYPALLSIISNIAPYQRGLARATSSKMIDLFTLLSSPSFLLASENNHTLVMKLLDAINGILDNTVKDNPRFVEVLVGSRARFKALRTLTIEGALAELNRQGQERKDRGLDGGNGQSYSRGPSMDSVRSPSALRTPTLEEVPEDERFDIGDDDGDEIEGVDNDMHNGTPHLDESADQLHQMSEKARGKQPASRVMALSRTTSASSLPTVSTITSQPFRPSQEWLESWYETLPLSTVFKTINEAKIGGGIPEKTTRSIDQAMHAHNDGKFTPGANIELTNTAPVTAEPPSNFEWSSVARVWYMSELWGRIYIQEAEVSQGIGGLYSGTNIVLFKRSSSTQEISLRSPKGAIDAVGNSLAQRISNISLKRE
ncbi:uncharacterized protein K489DRAFT_318710 [Dissoconium aciculare CBS 342.82]|uniref:High-temperature-induced dauer-formation protein n=1 Tax=Dissoconium aciculare CBS 342.82 TaxID=1314786 RepID=A0A6J3M7E3_9PEZI|nr:uncharacterized protein K489DRAFT_318710 [Dissoconium aciculare CBS 342.82]KAF1822772.1 hypothetical protein K489DRAFT_318710 [Dissoconium aciculare CBS 342.82]